MNYWWVKVNDYANVLLVLFLSLCDAVAHVIESKCVHFFFSRLNKIKFIQQMRSNKFTIVLEKFFDENFESKMCSIAKSSLGQSSFVIILWTLNCDLQLLCEWLCVAGIVS